MSSVMHDLCFALRQMRRSPGFVMTAVLTLALGIGATTAIFTDRWMNLLGRLRPGVTATQAEADSAPLWHAFRAEELKALGKRSPRFVEGFLNRSQLFDLSPRLAGYTPERIPLLDQQLRLALAKVPGVASASVTNNPELAGNDHGEDISLEHYVPGQEEVHPQRADITPEYFNTMQVPLFAGRWFNDQDQSGRPLVAIVNRRFALRYFGSERKALGQRLVASGGKSTAFHTEIAPMTLVLGRLVQSQLYGVTPTDPVSLVWAVVVLATVALLAAAVPTWRAVSVNPTEALRTE